MSDEQEAMPINPQEEFVTIATFQTPVEAEAMRLFLESNGIDALVADEHMSANLSIAVGGVKLQVPESQVKPAAQLVEEQRALRRSKSIDSDQQPIIVVCEECGRTISFPGHRAGGVESCPHCGKYVDVPEN